MRELPLHVCYPSVQWLQSSIVLTPNFLSSESTSRLRKITALTSLETRISLLIVAVSVAGLGLPHFSTFSLMSFLYPSIISVLSTVHLNVY